MTEEAMSWRQYASGEWQAFLSELDVDERELLNDWLDGKVSINPRDVDHVIFVAREMLQDRKGTQ